MSETPSDRVRPGPKPIDPDQPFNYVVDRRKVVFGVGFGLLSAASIRHLDNGRRPVVTTSPRPTAPPEQNSAVAGESLINASAEDDFSGPLATEEPFDAPILDASARLAPGQSADVVLTGGRIIDPDTGFDRVGNVALIGSTIVEISDQPIQAGRQVDASNLVISPGFIDVLSYEPNEYGEWWKIADGVTSNIGMHGLRFDAANFLSQWETTGVPINFGGAVHNSHIRQQLGFLPSDTADGSAIRQITAAIETQVQDGFLGIHVQPEYAPGVSANEMLDMGRMAASLGVPLCVHARFSDNAVPGLQADAIRELIDVADQTGCHVHAEHINSTGGTGRMADALAELGAAIDGGLSMTACMYPYEFWATYLQTSRFDDWQNKFGLSFEDLQVAGTNERLTAETYEQAYESNALTAAYAISDTDVNLAIQAPFMMIGSDAILEPPHNNHPRSTGAYSRTIGEYSRDRGLISLHQALAMMTIRPAEFLQISTPQMATKGRMQIGADADITVFDPATIIDRSTLENPAQESSGVHYVFVNGTEVRNPDGNVETARPGVAITSVT